MQRMLRQACLRRKKIERARTRRVSVVTRANPGGDPSNRETNLLLKACLVNRDAQREL